MTVREYYDTITECTAAIAATDFAAKVVEAAKTGDPTNVEKVFEEFKEKNPELFEKIKAFGAAYRESKLGIFVEKKDKTDQETMFHFELSGIQFYMLVLLAEIDECPMFYGDITALAPLREEGYEQMADYFEGDAPEYPCYEMLTKIFASKN